METQKYISEALLKEEPTKALKLVLKDNAVTESKLEDGAVTTNKLKDGCVTKEKLANDISFGTATSEDIDTINRNIDTIMNELLSPEIKIDKTDGDYEFIHDENTNIMTFREGYVFNSKKEPIPNNGTWTDVFLNRTYTVFYNEPVTYKFKKGYDFSEDRVFSFAISQPATVHLEVSGQGKYKGINIIFPTKTFSFWFVYPSYIGFMMAFEFYAQSFDTERDFPPIDVRDNMIKEITSGIDDEYTIEQKDGSDCQLCAIIPKNGNVNIPTTINMNDEKIPLLKEEYNFWTVCYTERKFKAGTYTFYIS